jgi:hypothetical protein
MSKNPIDEPESQTPPKDGDSKSAPKIDSKTDTETDKAVDDIQHKDSDTELDAAFAPVNVSGKRSLKQKYLDNKKWTMPVTAAVVLLAVIFALPVTRYKTFGLFVSQPVALTFTDATTHNPVTSAQVKLDGSPVATTSASGKVLLAKVKPGNHQLTITKQYYKTLTKTVFVGLSAPPAQKQTLQATGRQVSVSIINTITGKPISGANISTLGTSAKTDSSGVAHLVLPADKTSAAAQLTAVGYNNSSATVQVLAKTTTDNSFKMVPAGRAYFLSNRSGKVDVISTNYDGSDRQTLLAGTGYEDVTNTQLIPSPGQKYLALIAKRSSADNSTGLYIIATATGKTIKAEEAAALSIRSVGWNGDYFVYTYNNLALNQWQPNQVLIKSYNAGTSTAATLDQTQASGDQNNFTSQNFSTTITIIDGNVLYGTYWTASYGYAVPDTDMDTINTVQLSGSGKKVLKSLTIPPGNNYISLEQVLQSPEVSYFKMPTSADGSATGALFFKYYKGTLTQTNSFTNANFTDQNIANGFNSMSPSGTASLFADSVDGHLVVSTGDATGANKAVLAQLPTDGFIQSWLTDDYILVTQNTNQLYVVSATGGKSAQPLQTSDFLVPPHAHD